MRIEGEKKGEKRAKLETAKRMLNDGLPIESIAKYTGLTEKEIKEKKEVYRLINQYITALRKKGINVCEIYLFGSYAKGIFSEWSDIDVAILTDKFIGDSFDFRFLLMKIARDIEHHPFPVDEFNEDNPAAAEILRTGEKVNF
jgi:predicted nucleotidyltransferase